MTTFEAVSAHWPRQPKPPRSTQRSKKPRGSIKTSSIVGHSSPPVIDSSQGNALPISSPIKAGDPTLPLADINADIKPDILAIDGHESPMRAAAGHVDPNEPILEEPEGIEEFSDSDDDVNPFEAFAMTQASQGAPDIKADINKNMISRAAAENPEDVDEEELAMQQHERDARQRAEEGVRFRATQMPSKADDSDEYDDDELDELFRRTVAGGWSTQTTPKKRTGAASAVSTSATASSRNTVGSEARRERHALRVREEAGLGDLR
jgi:DNA polymerase zeta